MFIDLTPEQRALRDELRGYFAGLMTPAERAELLTERHGAAYRDVTPAMVQEAARAYLAPGARSVVVAHPAPAKGDARKRGAQ